MALALACACAHNAAASEVVSDARMYEGKTIRSITFTPADYPLKASKAMALLPFGAGSTFHTRQLREAIQSLYATGRYTQILVDAQETPGGIALRFTTTPAYFVGHVAIHNINAPPNQDQLLGAAKLALGTPFEQEDGANAAESMTTILRNNGFYSAHVETQTEFDPATAQASIDFFLHPGKRARYAHPEFGEDSGLPASELIRASRWQRLFGFLGWDTISDARTRQGLAGIRQLYDKQGLLEADVRLAGMRYDQESNTASPELSISPGPHVSVTVIGANLPASELRRLLPVYQESKVDETLLDEGARNLENYFQSQGFFGAQVTHKMDADRLTSNTAVTYSVVRGQRSRFVHLEVRGNRYFGTALILERLTIQPATLPRFPHGRFSNALLLNDVHAIENLYAANGFREVQVTSHLLMSFHDNPRQLGVEIDIKEGPQSRVAQLAIVGPNSSDLAVLTKQCSSIPGQPFSDTALAADREMILNYYYDRGYPSASFQASVEPVQGKNQVSLRYEVTPGPQRFVERVIVTGLETTRPDVVLRRIELHAGDPLSLSRQTDSQRKLYNLGVFARVNAAVQNPGGDEISKVLLFDIGEAKHYSFNAGVGAQIARIGGGVTTLDNPAGTTGFAPRFTAGITRDNFLGLGQQIGLQTAISTLEQRVALTYFIPEFTSNPNLSLTSTAVFDSSNDVRTYTATRREASVQLGERLSKAYTLQYRLVFRNVKLGNLKIDRLLVPLLSQPETVGLGELSFIADRRDDPTDAHHGSYTTLDVAYAPGFLGSQTIFGRLLSRNSTYYQLTRNLVFARSTQFGAIWRAGGRPVVPLAERLYSGGSTSLRAFPDFQAGPRDPTTGFPLGGNALLINNLELRFPLYGDNISGVVFQDAGNVYASIKDFSARFRQENLQDFGYMVQDVGFGIRYRTPVGPIRVDLSLSPDAPRFFGLKGTLQQLLNGTAMSTVQKINAFQFHISLGQAF